MTHELKLTADDRAFLAAMGTSDGEAASQFVSAIQYQAVVEARDAAVTRIFVLLGKRRRMWARYRALRKRLRRTEWMAVVIIGGLILWKW